jgi:hypothetical protein
LRQLRYAFAKPRPASTLAAKVNKGSDHGLANGNGDHRRVSMRTCRIHGLPFFAALTLLQARASAICSPVMLPAAPSIRSTSSPLYRVVDDRGQHRDCVGAAHSSCYKLAEARAYEAPAVAARPAPEKS